ncbi:MAG: hypothetical protein AAF399_23585 [Bacteroidota bacterium]
MERLSTDWFLEGNLDFEYKKYVLLAYLQHVSREFAEVRLYPSLKELILQYRNLHHFHENKALLKEQFPSRLSKEEFKRLQLVRESEVEPMPEMQEIESIVAFALPQFQSHLRNGKELYEYIQTQLEVEPIGITPLYKKEGYLFLRVDPGKQVKVFQYHQIFLENTEGNFYGISFDWVETFDYGLANTYEAKKLQLVRQFSHLPNPATWLMIARQAFPEEASLLPVAKRKMLGMLKQMG